MAMSLRNISFAQLWCIAILLVMGCESRSSRTISSETIKVSADDKRIASRVVELVKPKVASNGELARRYGIFVSMELRSIKRLASVKVYGYKTPVAFLVKCFCRFDKFSTIVDINVIKDANFNIKMVPTEEFATQEDGPLSDCELIQDGDELWFVRTGGDGMRVRSVVTCQIPLYLLSTNFEP